MKVNEIITEASIWDLASKANQIRKQASVSKQRSQQLGQQQAASMMQPNPARHLAQPTTQTPASGTKQGLPPNVKVLATNPVVLQVDKLKFELDDFNKWHPLNRPTVEVSAGQSAILNQYLQML